MKAAEDKSGTIEAGGRVLVVDDHRQARESIADVLRQAGHEVSCCSSAAEALKVVERDAFDCVVTDLQMPGMSWIELIVQLERRRYGAQIVMVTAHASVSTAVEAMRHGAFDYIEKPFDVDQLESLVGKAIRNGRLLLEANRNERAMSADVAPVMVGTSPAMHNLRDKIARLAPTPETVLIHGESGTGKELVAKTIHAMSSRAKGPMVSLNCPVLSVQLMESELFGHERGAFTGAEASRTGRFEMAHGGSILLDEVTEIDLNLQAKLLRVLQEMEFERVGGKDRVRVNARIIAATNKDLKAMVKEGRFRDDLYYRLNIVAIQIPPLRERRDDIPVLVDYLIAKINRDLHKKVMGVSQEVMETFMKYSWPGNIRELENLLVRAVVVAKGQILVKTDFPDLLENLPVASEDRASLTDTLAGPAPFLTLDQMEEAYIRKVLAENSHKNKGEICDILGISRPTLERKLEKYKISFERE